MIKKVSIINKFNAQSFPLLDKFIEISDEDLLQIGITKCFDVENNCVVDYDNTNDLQKEQNQKLLNEYKSWFDNYFVMQLQQHSWQDDYIPSYDNYFNCGYKTWQVLCEKANTVRQKIKELKELIK